MNDIAQTLGLLKPEELYPVWVASIGWNGSVRYQPMKQRGGCMGFSY